MCHQRDLYGAAACKWLPALHALCSKSATILIWSLSGLEYWPCITERERWH